MGGASTEPVVSDRVLTVPNALSFLRLLGVPVFLWLIVAQADGWAVILLVVSGATDYLDGKIARAFGQVSRVGQLLDPLADRLYVLTTLFGLAWRDIVPWWFVAALLGRDAVMLVVMARLKRAGQVGLPVNVVGKAATMNLLYAFPLLLLSTFSGWVGSAALITGWAFAWWGLYLYWLAALFYLVQAARVLAARRAVAGIGPEPAAGR